MDPHTFIPVWAVPTSTPFASVYDGEDDGDGDGDPPPTPPAPAPEDKDKGKAKVKLTVEQQAFVNSLVAEEKRKAQAKNDALITQLETERNRAGTSAAEKAQLEERIEGLKSEYQTKDELQSRETKKRVAELEARNKALEAEGLTWKSRYDRDRKRIDLTQAASVEKAYNPRQVVNELEAKSRLVEIVGEDGKGTGEYETKVRLSVPDKDGKAVTLELDPLQAVKQLKEMNEYANLFISPAQGGLGGGNLGRGGPGGGKAPHEMTPAEYIQARRKTRTGS